MIKYIALLFLAYMPASYASCYATYNVENGKVLYKTCQTQQLTVKQGQELDDDLNNMVSSHKQPSSNDDISAAQLQYNNTVQTWNRLGPLCKIAEHGSKAEIARKLPVGFTKEFIIDQCEQFRLLVTQEQTLAQQQGGINLLPLNLYK